MGYITLEKTTLVIKPGSYFLIDILLLATVASVSGSTIGLDTVAFKNLLK